MVEADAGYLPNLTLSVINLRTGLQTQMRPDTSNSIKQAVWANLSRESMVEPGDQLEIQIHDSAEQLVGTLEHQVSTDDIEHAFVQVDVKAGDILPGQTQFLANYPNPFNPET